MVGQQLRKPALRTPCTGKHQPCCMQRSGTTIANDVPQHALIVLLQQTRQDELPAEETTCCLALLVTLVLKRQRLILWTTHVVVKGAFAIASQLFVVT